MVDDGTPDSPPHPDLAPPEHRFGQDLYQDPLTHYGRLRESEPVARATFPNGMDAWLITRYDDVRAALADPRLSNSPRTIGIEPDGAAAGLNDQLLSLDPPDHTRLRRLVTSAFTMRRVEALRPRVEEITTDLLDALDAGPDVADLLPALAEPLPVTVICELLGIPPSDREDFMTWSHVMLAAEPDPAEHGAAVQALAGYMTKLVAIKRAQPQDDLLSALVHTEAEGDVLAGHELTAMVFLLLIAGHETTVNLIASGTLALLQHPRELERLRSDPALLPDAVGELLRYVNPLNHAVSRFTREPVEVGGVTIPAGAHVLAVTSAANHDPERFENPGELDLSRDTKGHLSFGHGIHYCLGAPLARLEGEVAFGSLLSRFPDLALAVPEAELRWRPSDLIRGLEELPVRLR